MPVPGPSAATGQRLAHAGARPPRRPLHQLLRHPGVPHGLHPGPVGGQEQGQQRVDGAEDDFRRHGQVRRRRRAGQLPGPQLVVDAEFGVVWGTGLGETFV